VKRGDFYILIVMSIIMLGLIIMYQFTLGIGDPYIEIKVNNQIIKSIKLNPNEEIKLILLTDNGNYKDLIVLREKDQMPVNLTQYDIISIHDNGVEVIESDCPRKIIIKQGFIKRPNIPLICVPYKVSIIIKNKEINDGFDALT